MAKELRGPERFFYDKSTYTGVHTAGGPSTIDKDGVSKYSDLSEMTRPGLRGAGTGSTGLRPASSGRSGATSTSPRPPSRTREQAPGSAGADESGGRALRGPERFFYDKTTYTGVHTNGGPSTIDKDGVSKFSDLSEMTRPALRGTGGSTAVRTGTAGGTSASPRPSSRGRPGSRAGEATAAGARLVVPGAAGTGAAGSGRVASTSPSPGGDRPLRGPERFFYDKSSYTGVHTRGGPSTTAGAGVHDLSEITRPGMR